MLNNIIEEISREFLLEGQNSPSLLADMASMEKYMAESYGERILIELLQNADDANSSNVLLDHQDNNIFFANNGRSFSMEDIISICRSGASTKRRGSSIGYRGVGFKSTSYLSNEIIIYSSGTYFTFSKKKCAAKLNVEDINQVPTIRIPFLIQESEIEKEVVEYVEALINKGFNTVFIFMNANINFIEDEIAEVNNGYFLFLNNITLATMKLVNTEKAFVVNRTMKDEYKEVEISSSDNIETWLIFRNEIDTRVVVAFKSDEEGKITNCNIEEAVFHCYLPTLDKTGFPFKINCDFSTDPSRKHLSFDEETRESLNKSSSLLFQMLKAAFSDVSFQHPEIIELLNKKSGFSKFSIHLFDALKVNIEKNKWIELNSGESIYPSQYKLCPKWLEKSEFNIIREKSSYVNNLSLPHFVYERIQVVEQFLESYSQSVYDINDFVEMLKEKDFVTSINLNLLGKIYGNIIKQFKLKSLIVEFKLDLSDCKLVMNNDINSLFEIEQSEFHSISESFKEAFCETGNYNDVKWFDDIFATNFASFFSLNEKKPSLINQLLSKNEIITNHISKWRAGEQQCIELEKIFGNKAIDVSKQNLGYDVESRNPDGTLRYIEVKSISKTNLQFTMTNNEYSAAHQFGCCYYICVIKQNEDKFSATYIQDPINTLKMEKRARQWEWYCDEYSGEEFTMNLK